MEKMSFVIKHLHMKGLTPKEIKAEMDNVHSIICTNVCDCIQLGMNLNMGVHPYMMHLVRDVQLRLLCQKSSIKSTILFWLIDEWKCANLLRPQAYLIAQWFQFCTNNWVWKSYAKWVSRLLTMDHKRDHVMISKQCLEKMFVSVIQMNFCVDSLLWMKHGSITSPETNE